VVWGLGRVTSLATRLACVYDFVILIV